MSGSKCDIRDDQRHHHGQHSRGDAVEHLDTTTDWDRLQWRRARRGSAVRQSRQAVAAGAHFWPAAHPGRDRGNDICGTIIHAAIRHRCPVARTCGQSAPHQGKHRRVRKLEQQHTACKDQQWTFAREAGDAGCRAVSIVPRRAPCARSGSISLARIRERASRVGMVKRSDEKNRLTR